MKAITVTLLAFSILFVAGCGGCRDDSSPTSKKDATEKKTAISKPDFENRLPVLLPAVFPKKEKDRDTEENSKLAETVRKESLIQEAIQRNRTKLGHWATAYFQVLANNYNASGELLTQSVDGSARPIPILSTDYYIRTSRPASLAKGEWKSLEASIYLPRRKTVAGTANVDYVLRNTTTGLSMMQTIQPTSLMKPFQYHIVLLSNRSQAYNYLTSLDSVSITESLSNGDPFPPFYYVVPSRVNYPVPLPRQALNWTTIAYVLWDDFTPDQLDEHQQSALLDWIHQGGQLILSGPDSLDKLRGSFLDEYLPAEFESTFNLANSDISELNENWSVPVKKNKSEKRALVISPGAPLVAVRYTPHPNATFVDGTGGLVVERRIGRGRIVATSFSLDDQLIRKWRSFNSFFNGCLLRRPARKWGRTSVDSMTFEWVDDNTSLFDPLIGSSLRYLSRDLNSGGTPETHFYQMAEQEQYNRWNPFGGQNYNRSPEEEFLLNEKRTIQRDQTNIWRYGGYADDPQSGTAGWNDASGVSRAARQTLKQAAGISPPSAAFVLKMLVAYLIVLIPLNWLFFKLIGRVEWAWIAAPVIAVAGAFTVVKMASLDIGFVRSNTQIGLLEVYSDYPRGHMTEYSALYTSLSTRYDVELDNPSAQTLPFAANFGKRFKPKETVGLVTLDRSRENRLRGFQVQSNSTGMLHSEYTIDLNGRINLEQTNEGRFSISNSTRIDIADAAVVHRDSEGDFFVSTIGLLPSGGQTDTLQFKNVSADEIQSAWSDNPDYVGSSRLSRQIWIANIGNLEQDSSLDEISNFPELESQWPKFQKIFINRSRGKTKDELLHEKMGFAEFDEIMNLLGGNSGINVGRLFDVVLENLELELGGMRLIGLSSQPIGNTRFIPESTQTDRQTLIVVHLKKGKLPPARRDENSMADFGGRSNLDMLLEE